MTTFGDGGPYQPDLAGGYDETSGERGPSGTEEPTVEAEPDAGGPGMQLDFTGYAVATPAGPLGQVSHQLGTGPDARLVVDLLEPAGETQTVALTSVTHVDHQARVISVESPTDG